MATDWKRLQALNAEQPILFIEPRIDAKDETWFYAADSSLRVHSAGVLHQGREPGATSGPITARHAQYKLADELFVDVEVRGAHAVLRRGLLNGALVANTIPSSEVEPTLARYRKLGFKDGTPWNPNPSKVTLREYRSTTDKWTVHVDGQSVFEDWTKETKTASREAALEAAEKAVAAKEEKGFALTLIELTKGRYPNPSPAVPKGVSKPKPPAARPVFPQPSNPFEAVDLAVARLKELHERLPRNHLVLELIDAEKDRARVEEVEAHPKFFLGMHSQRVGRWRKARKGKPKKGESSWSYFARVYGSITWILAGTADDDLPMFYCGNVTGGGWSPLEIAPALYDLTDVVEATGDASLNALEVFHGGWDRGLAFAFDKRAADDAGEHPILPFDDGDPSLPKRPKKPVPFGDWLFARVEKLTRVAERNLREL